MIVCICANVSDRTIAQAVREGCQSVEDITMKTGACSGCGQCRGHCQAELQAHAAVAQAKSLTEHCAVD
ncbi:MAG TPA: (2Fe-2S)-binding protein [Limnobacter sp.]|uniref:(2Fe-2S)-binding protein n=1 Tax=Limnobacter sp. TaxID=2003368 RepID=UPI002EDA3CF4